jgi:DNA-binding SARP family transcriptional activator
MIEFFLFGTTDIRRDDGADLRALLSQPRPVALLAYLAIAGPRPGAFHRRDTLIGLFWQESGQEQARNNLRKLVHIARRALGDEVIEARGDEELRLAPDLAWCDVVEFETAIARGHHARADELYRGELMPGFYVPGAPVPEFDAWLSSRRMQLAEAAADVAWKLATRSQGERNVTDSARYAIRAARLSLHNERRFKRAIELLIDAGMGGRAIELYNELCRKLAELGLRPDAELRQLIEALRRR